MVKRRKPSLRKALKKIDEAPDTMFGNMEIDISDLPCLRKVSREKITTNIDSDVLAVMKTLAREHGVSYSALMNDVLRKIFIEDKRAG